MIDIPGWAPRKRRSTTGSPHTALVKAMLWRLKTLPLSDWAQQSVVATMIEGRAIRAGVKGQADISGVVGPEGWRCEIECKTGTGRLTPWQKEWKARMQRCGSIWILCRDPDAAFAELTHEIQQRRKR